MGCSSTFAHLSDLHIGRSDDTHRRAGELVAFIEAAGIETVMLTGDLTHRGRRDEWTLFKALFAPLLRAGKVVMVPGNHDCLGDDLSAEIMDGGRVEVCSRPGLRVIRYNSTGPHNRSWIASHGRMRMEDLRLIVAAAEAALADEQVVLLLHHHLLPLPVDGRFERLASWLSLPFTEELALGRELLASLVGRCDLVLHGHRHQPGAMDLFPHDRRPLRVFNAGCSPELMSFRLFEPGQAGAVGAPVWLSPPSASSPLRPSPERPATRPDRADEWPREEHRSRAPL